ncbi:conjugal transfer protein TraM [Shinella yambaruensis]|uniref:Conjugal transfer protein TraM n=1 Tax=Shinella yambaruensis TaxID=415996 RepID=A0ABQ5ZQP6_9HYPH|nr:conjugal transfer protein TraM [Shinella yambaruensis]MCJ8029951.1 conjugal transfer protein TraM [Shinella yambaruensis]MCU7984208.1 conjugal transfer protein TraM [Shinella yambaruensis]GLR55198.1 hypothetical protein GCM10007923_64200 [Shinella yambaruensis]
MNLDFDEIRKEVSLRHGVLLGRDDPILVTVTINEMVLSRYLELAAKQYDEANRSLTITLQQQVEQSKQTAGKVITDAGDYIAQQVKHSTTIALQEALTTIRQHTTEAQSVARQALTAGDDAHTAKSGAVIAACIAGVAALLSIAALAMVVLS